jgi:hypothetical protein
MISIKVCGHIVSTSNFENNFGCWIDFYHLVTNCEFTKIVISSFQIKCQMQNSLETKVKILFLIKYSNRPSRFVLTNEPRMKSIFWAHI